MDSYHIPVLLQSVCAHLHVTPGHKYVDATIGGGGHTQQIISLGGYVLGLDQDPDAIAACHASEALQPALASGQLILVHTNFIHLTEAVKQASWAPLSGILIDLGMSSHQLNTPSRGFSFQAEGPLDMRMDLSLPNTAATLVNSLPTPDLARILKDFAEVPSSRSIAQKIVAGRPYTDTWQLFTVLGQPQLARQVFQALRIAVNDEFGAIRSVLPQCLEVLAPGGHLVIISFHSLEDYLVKDQFLSWTAAGLGEIATPQPVVASSTELEQNSRSKSAKLRAFTKAI